MCTIVHKRKKPTPSLSRILLKLKNVESRLPHNYAEAEKMWNLSLCTIVHKRKKPTLSLCRILHKREKGAKVKMQDSENGVVKKKDVDALSNTLYTVASALLMASEA